MCTACDGGDDALVGSDCLRCDTIFGNVCHKERETTAAVMAMCLGSEPGEAKGSKCRRLCQTCRPLMGVASVVGPVCHFEGLYTLQLYCYDKGVKHCFCATRI